MRRNTHFNQTLTNINALSSLTSVSGIFRLWSNYSLININGLENLISIGGKLWIEGNTSLANVQEFENLTSIGDNLRLLNNMSLVSLNGLDNLTSIGGNLRIESNISLLNLNGLDNLSSISGYIDINSNASLSSLNGIQNINPNSIYSSDVDSEDLSIYSNPLLTVCSVQSICSFLELPFKTKNIHNNNAGCNNEQEIINACPVTATHNPDNIVEKLKIYPNPSFNDFTIDFSETSFKDVEVGLFDLSGIEHLHIKKSTKIIDIKTENLNSGLYIIKIKSDNGVNIFRKVRIQK